MKMIENSVWLAFIVSVFIIVGSGYAGYYKLGRSIFGVAAAQLGVSILLILIFPWIVGFFSM